MSVPTVDPRVIADALQMDTYDLSRILVDWSGKELTGPTYETSSQPGPTPLDVFDARVERARRYLESAHAAFDAWYADNPPDEPDDEAA